jgi:hypothetical protein
VNRSAIHFRLFRKLDDRIGNDRLFERAERLEVDPGVLDFDGHRSSALRIVHIPGFEFDLSLLAVAVLFVGAAVAVEKILGISED